MPRQIDSAFRLRSLFRRVDSETSAPRARNTYPVVEHNTVLASPQPAPFVEVLRGSQKVCGRQRNRRRRLFRRSFRLPRSAGLKLGCINTQGVQWNLAPHTHKLQVLLHAVRRQKLDVAFLTDLHFFTLEIQYVYVEEFLLMCRGRVGILLRNSVATEWESQNRPVFFLDATDRLLAIEIHGRHLALCSMYSPDGNALGPKRAHYNLARSFCSQLQQRHCEFLMGGDFNGHIGANDGYLQLVGPQGLPTDTTLGGRELKQFLAASSLVRIDSWKKIKFRGTWRHNIAGKWYELDGFRCSPSLFPSVQPGLSTFSADHFGKQMFFHLGSLQKRTRRLKRRETWTDRLRTQANLHSESRVKCPHSILRGVGSHTSTLITRFQQHISEKLDSLGVSILLS